MEILIAVIFTVLGLLVGRATLPPKIVHDTVEVSAPAMCAQPDDSQLKKTQVALANCASGLMRCSYDLGDARNDFHRLKEDCEDDKKKLDEEADTWRDRYIHDGQ